MQQIDHINISITAFFAAILAFFYVKLSFDIIKIRQRKRITIGDGGDESLARARAAQSNLTDNALVFIALLLIAELEQISSFMLISLSLIFLAARVLHVHSIKVYEVEKKSYGLRVLSMMASFGVIIALGVINLYNSLF